MTTTLHFGIRVDGVKSIFDNRNPVYSSINKMTTVLHGSLSLKNTFQLHTLIFTPFLFFFLFSSLLKLNRIPIRLRKAKARPGQFCPFSESHRSQPKGYKYIANSNDDDDTHSIPTSNISPQKQKESSSTQQQQKQQLSCSFYSFTLSFTQDTTYDKETK